MSDQLWASCNLDLWTAGVCSTNLHDSLSPVIKKTPCMAATIAQSVLIDTYYTHYFTIISIICIIIHIISSLEIHIWVHIRCRKLANRHIHNWGSVSKQNHVQEGLKYQSITNCPWPRAILPEAAQLPLSCRSTWICLADVRHPPSAYSRLEIITQLINSLGNGCAFVQPDVIRIPSSIRTWKW